MFCIFPSPGAPIAGAVRILLFSVIFAILWVSGAFAEKHGEEKRLAVLPFAVHGDEAYLHMEKTAPDMFSSRINRVSGYSLVSDSRVKALEIDPADVDVDHAVSAGRDLDADMVLYGRLTMIGENWSMDVFLVDVARKRRIGSFSHSGGAGSEMIPGIEAMAADVNGILEALSDKASAVPREAPDATDPPSGEVGLPLPAGVEAPGAWSGPEMEGDFVGIAAGDVFGEGETAMILAAREALYIYSLADGRFNRRQKIEAPSHTVCMAVDAGDINGSGTAEIFVTASNNRGNALRSFVLEYREGAFEILQEKTSWFYRVVREPDGTPVLLGQRHRMETDPFGAPVFRMIPENGGYAPGELLMEEKAGINVLGFAMGRIRSGGTPPGTIGFDDGDRLRIFGPDGEMKWSSNRRYGGGKLFLNGPKAGMGDPPEQFYLPVRIVVAGTAAPGQDVPDRMFVFRNTRSGSIGLKRIRSYAGGEILALSWDGAGLREDWKTREYDGHFRDIYLADFTGDGIPELAALLIEKEGWTIFSDSRARVVIFPMQEKQEERRKQR